jgi:hypothetical protein
MIYDERDVANMSNQVRTTQIGHSTNGFAPVVTMLAANVNLSAQQIRRLVRIVEEQTRTMEMESVGRALSTAARAKAHAVRANRATQMAVRELMTQEVGLAVVSVASFVAAIVPPFAEQTTALVTKTAVMALTAAAAQDYALVVIISGVHARQCASRLANKLAIPSPIVVVSRMEVEPAHARLVITKAVHAILNALGLTLAAQTVNVKVLVENV